MVRDDIQSRFGARIRELRKQRGLTQEQLAEAIGKSVDTISNIERGFSSTRIKTAARLAEILEVALPDLFEPATRPRLDRKRQQLVNELTDMVAACDPDKRTDVLNAFRSVVKAAAGPD